MTSLQRKVTPMAREREFTWPLSPDEQAVMQLLRDISISQTAFNQDKTASFTSSVTITVSHGRINFSLQKDTGIGTESDAEMSTKTKKLVQKIRETEAEIGEIETHTREIEEENLKLAAEVVDTILQDHPHKNIIKAKLIQLLNP